MREEVMGIFCADLHFSLTPPPLRSQEPDWFAAMQRPINELKTLQENNHGCPIFVAGDIFNRWDSGPELINWVMRVLPYVHAIPGQHDMPEHDPAQMERSAYTTLVRANKIWNLTTPQAFYKSRFVVWPFPYGSTVEECPPRHKDKTTDVALIHEYNWIETCNEAHADTQSRVSSDRVTFSSYDAVFSGDNHQPFTVSLRNSCFVNCGAIMLRKSSDSFKPGVWLLTSDGKTHRHNFDTSQDMYLDILSAEDLENHDTSVDLSQLMEVLGRLGECSIDFISKMRTVLYTVEDIRKTVKTLIREAMKE